MDIEKQIRQTAQANVGDGPAGHTKGRMCAECVQHKAHMQPFVCPAGPSPTFA